MSLTISYPFEKKFIPAIPTCDIRLLGRLSPSNFSCIESDCEAPEVIHAASHLFAIVIVAGVLSYKNPMPGNTSFGSGLPPWSKTTLDTIVLQIGFLKYMKSSTWKLNISPSGNVFSIQVLSWSDLGTEDDGFFDGKNDAPNSQELGIDNEACRSSWNDG